MTYGTFKLRDRFNNYSDCMNAYFFLRIFSEKHFELNEDDGNIVSFGNAFKYVTGLLSNSSNAGNIYTRNFKTADLLLSYAKYSYEQKIVNPAEIGTIINLYNKFYDFAEELSSLNEAPGLARDYINTFNLSKKFTSEEISFFIGLMNYLTTHLSHRDEEHGCF